MNCFVWRVPRPNEYFSDRSWKFKFVRDELINNHILRQGWGIEDLRKGVYAYIAEWNRRGWGDSSKKRFGILKPMLDIQVGDPIVIPKLSIRNGEIRHGRYFTIVICTKVYDFAFPNNICEQDFGHFIEVDPNRMITCDYDSSNMSAHFIGNTVLQPGFNSYNYAFHEVNDTRFESAVAVLKP